MESNPQTFTEFWQNLWQMLVDINVPRLAGALLVLIVGLVQAWRRGDRFATPTGAGPRAPRDAIRARADRRVYGIP